MIRRVAGVAAIVMATLGVLLLLWQFRSVVGLFLLSVAIAAATRPAVESLTDRRFPRGLASVLVHILVLTAFVVLIVAIGGQILSELQQVSDYLVRVYDRIWAEWPNGTEFQRSIVAQLPPPAELYETIAGEQGLTMVQAVLGVTFSSVSLVSQFFAVFVLAIYWTIDRIHFERLWLSTLTVEIRARAREIWREVETGVGAYIRSEIIQCLIAGVLLGIGFWLIGLNYAVLLAVFGALAWLIPLIGGFLALIPVAIVGFSMGTGMGILAVLLTVSVFLFLEFIVEPRLFRRLYSSLLVVLLLIALVDVLGLVGLLIAPPLAAAIQLFFRSIIPTASQPVEIESVRKIADLDERVQSVRELAAASEKEPSPQAASMLDRLDQLITKANRLIEED